MREFTRIVLRVAMVLFLMVGCVQNVYYLGELAKKGHTNNRYHYNRYEQSATTIDADEVEEVTPPQTVEEEENDMMYPDYNRQDKPVTAY